MLRKKKHDPDIYPDEIFMDSENVSEFDKSQFEGRIEKPINKKTYGYLSAGLVVIAVFFLSKIFLLQIINGEKYYQRSQKNSLKKEFVMPLRGAIYDKNNVVLAWNGEEGRQYADMAGLSHTLGYIGLPSKEDLNGNPNLLPNEIIGKVGIEKEYNLMLEGIKGLKLIEKDSQNNIVSENIQEGAQNGQKLTLTIDAKLQSKFFEIMNAVAKERGFSGGAGVIMNVRDGSVAALVSWPEFNSQILANGGPPEEIKKTIEDKNRPFLNRVVSGIYAPGSVVKPFVALAALNEGVIGPEKQIFSSGSISIPNPFFADKPTVFKDWKAHGWVDMRRALAVSSDVYFYEVGGGFEDVRGLGINKLSEYAKKFGLDSLTGIDLPGELRGTVPTQELKQKNNPGDPIWRVGDTYNTSIGQGYFLATPIEIASYVSAVANNGKIVRPHVLEFNNGQTDINQSIPIPENYFKIVKEGMRMAILDGTAQGLNIPNVEIAAKTGTAEIISKKFTNSWIIGFFPYENPKYSFTVVMEKGHPGNTVGAPYIMRELLNWMALYAPEYFKNE